MAGPAGHRQLATRALRRFWAVALIATILAGLAAYWAVDLVSRATYTSNALYIVPTAPAPVDGVPAVPTTLPTSPYDAERLAQTYTLVLTEDGDLLTTLTAATGVPAEDLLEDAVAENVPSSSAVRVTFTGESEQQVVTYFDTLSTVLATTGVPNLPAGNLQPLNARGEIVEQAGLAPVAPLVAILVGLVVGVGGAVVLERLDGRVRDLSDLRRTTTRPVFTLAGDREARLQTVALRVRTGGAQGRRAAVVSLPGGSATAAALAGELADAERRALRAGGQEAPSGTASRWNPAGALLVDGAAERAAVDADTVVLVVGPHTRLRTVSEAVACLDDLRAEDVVVVLDPAATRRAPTHSTPSGRPSPVAPRRGVSPAAR